MKYEHKRQPLLPRQKFLKRLLLHLCVASAIILSSLALGVAGYALFCGMDFFDALLNAAMILTGMGPVDKPVTIPGKLFATFYALFSGVVFLVAVGVLVAPLLHRLLHRFHLEVQA